MTKRANLRLLLMMAFFLPLWITVGRAVFGSFGWLLVIYVLSVAPILFASLLTLYFLARKVTLTLKDQWLLIALYISIFLHGVFVVDGGDTTESVNSIISYQFGESTENFSEALGFGLFFIGLALLITALSRVGLLYWRVRVSAKSNG